MESLRTCITCRKKDEKTKMLRFVRASDGELCFDFKMQAMARGVWTCQAKKCVLNLSRKRRLFNGLPIIPKEGHKLLGEIEEQIRKRVLANCSLLFRMRKLIWGLDAVKRACKEKDISLIILTKDFSFRSKDDIIKFLKSNSLLSIMLVESDFLKQELGNCLGCKKTGVVALVSCRITEQVFRNLEVLKKINLKQKLLSASCAANEMCGVKQFEGLLNG